MNIIFPKTALNGDNSVSFLEMDALSVFCQVDENSFENDKFTVSRLYDNGSADFQGTVVSTEGAMPVMYPYKEDAYIEKYGQTRKLYFSVPAEQKAVPGTFDPDAAISLGMASVGEDGKASDSDTGDNLFEKTEWSKTDWASAASWTGTSDVNWGAQSHVNNLDLVF